MLTAVRAADHGDGPTASNDQACDIADVFFFVDPNDSSKLVLIAPFRGFIVPAEAGNFGIFDPDVRYRFLIEKPGLNGETTGGGGCRTIDRMGIPAVNVVVIPLALKNRYNAGSTLQDSQGRFAPSIVATITAVMTGLGKTQTQIDAAVATLAGVAVSNGDMLRLNPFLPNAGNGGGMGANGFPNGCRLADDTIDTILTILNGGSALGDGVNANDVPLQNSFPFLAPPQQPRAPGVMDDNTRN